MLRIYKATFLVACYYSRQVMQVICSKYLKTIGIFVIDVALSSSRLLSLISCAYYDP